LSKLWTKRCCDRTLYLGKAAFDGFDMGGVQRIQGLPVEEHD